MVWTDREAVNLARVELVGRWLNLVSKESLFGRSNAILAVSRRAPRRVVYAGGFDWC